ncbi:hypothetical protein AZE42_03569 [Rhizopogon vesiculosus]|uniref:CCHC-type domain-containing protein n=1 Tax=Rhizopogon vesiculosus TaxID=180088 RepID=A0A1J8QUI7_9AGAM|nr:hypothetical protein AZE42_03569 [Rhizopogon vesiculosus]
MAARLPQVARLILFTGPNCSLCDVAKSELAKVRQSYQFDLEIVNIQDKGQEKWKKKYVYWIPALHLDGKEIAKGRWDASNVLESMRLRDELSRKHVLSILGETRSPSPEPLDIRCCFNCGLPDHTISSCPEPHNRPLIALSRQLFNFIHSDRQTGEPGRFHIVEAWKQQRLEWLEVFQPGEVVGPILREALGLQRGDSGQHCSWLYNMSRWGYPTGWVGDADPRDAVRQRILEDFRTVTHDNSSEDVDHTFFIFSDEQDNEMVDLTLATLSYSNRGGDEISVADDASSVNSNLESPSSTPRSADGQIGRLLAELLLTEKFSTKIKKLYCHALDPGKCVELAKRGVEIIAHKNDHWALAQALKATGADTIFLIPPAHAHKLKHSRDMIRAVKEAEIKNTVLLSSAGTDLAEEKHQPHLRQFTKIETETMQLRYTEGTTSQCIIRAGFYAENLLLYEKDMKNNNGKLRLPIGEQHSFAPVALDDVAALAAHILVSEGPKGLDDRFRGQLITLTGPMMCDGYELAAAATQAGLNLEFNDISDSEAKQLLDSDTDVDDSEKQYLLEYYSLVHEGKTNYVSTIAFAAVTGKEPTRPLEFFKSKKRRND